MENVVMLSKEIESQLHYIKDIFSSPIETPIQFIRPNTPVVVADYQNRCSFATVTRIGESDMYEILNYYDISETKQPTYVNYYENIPKLKVTVEFNRLIAVRVKKSGEYKSMENVDPIYLTAQDIYEFAMDARHTDFPLHQHTLLYMSIEDVED